MTVGGVAQKKTMVKMWFSKATNCGAHLAGRPTDRRIRGFFGDGLKRFVISAPTLAFFWSML